MRTFKPFFAILTLFVFLGLNTISLGDEPGNHAIVKANKLRTTSPDRSRKTPEERKIVLDDFEKLQANLDKLNKSSCCQPRVGEVEELDVDFGKYRRLSDQMHSKLFHAFRDSSRALMSQLEKERKLKALPIDELISKFNKLEKERDELKFRVRELEVLGISKKLLDELKELESKGALSPVSLSLLEHINQLLEDNNFRYRSKDQTLSLIGRKEILDDYVVILNYLQEIKRKYLWFSEQLKDTDKKPDWIMTKSVEQVASHRQQNIDNPENPTSGIMDPNYRADVDKYQKFIREKTSKLAALPSSKSIKNRKTKLEDNLKKLVEDLKREKSILRNPPEPNPQEMQPQMPPIRNHFKDKQQTPPAPSS